MSTSDGRVVFHARNLVKTYVMGEVEVHALQGVDLDLFDREFVVILGPSGSGKSTLLNILGGLDAPTSGAAVFRDHDLVAADDRALTQYRRAHVGFVFQFYNLIPSLTARENVALVTELSATPMKPEDALGLVGLGDRLDHFCATATGAGVGGGTHRGYRRGRGGADADRTRREARCPGFVGAGDRTRRVVAAHRTTAAQPHSRSPRTVVDRGQRR